MNWARRVRGARAPSALQRSPLRDVQDARAGAGSSGARTDVWGHRAPRRGAGYLASRATCGGHRVLRSSHQVEDGPACDHDADQRHRAPPCLVPGMPWARSRRCGSSPRPCRSASTMPSRDSQERPRSSSRGIWIPWLTSVRYFSWTAGGTRWSSWLPSLAWPAPPELGALDRRPAAAQETTRVVNGACGPRAKRAPSAVLQAGFGMNNQDTVPHDFQRTGET